MPYLIHYTCPLCHYKHDFYWHDDDTIQFHRPYIFTCPRKNTMTSHRFIEGLGGRVVRDRPPGAVPLELG